MIQLSLHCKVCDARQPVTKPDADDEDPRTLAIRKEFRAVHIASCGEGSVSLDVQGDDAGALVEEEPTIDWPAFVGAPSDVTFGADGFFSREVIRDGVPQNVRVCESCWKNIPRYIDFPFGLVSPDSDGDAQGNGAKVRRTAVEGKRGTEPLRMAVCLPCYLDAYARRYPGAATPKLSEDVVGDGTPIEPPPPPPDLPSGEDPLKFPQAMVDLARQQEAERAARMAEDMDRRREANA